MLRKAKGILPNPMPKSWYVYSENRIDETNDTQEDIEHKKLYQRICAHKKPYFFSYNYLSLKKEYDDYMANVNDKSFAMFKMSYKDLCDKLNKSEDEIQFVRWAHNKIPLDMSPSVLNKICWTIEDEFDDFEQPHKEKFDPIMIKSCVNYSNIIYREIEKIYKQYKKQMSDIAKKKKCDYYDDEFAEIDEYKTSLEIINQDFKEKCECACPNRYELCDILIDLCYFGRASKDIVWFVCGETIILNLLKNNNYNMYYPEKVAQNEDFECCGSKFIMKKIKVGGENE